jgi:hypothetical protein
MSDLPTPHKRRFPAPWRAVEIPGGYTVETADGKTLVRVYGRDDVRGAMPDMLTVDEARRIATAIARLPDLLKGAKAAT